MMAASLHTMLANLGMVLGISGFYHTTVKRFTGGTTSSATNVVVSQYFVSGLILGSLILGKQRDTLEQGLGIALLDPVHFGRRQQLSGILRAVFYGSLVGLGTKLGNGCTSGHFLCGLSRFSLRSLVATATFFGVAVATHLKLAPAMPAASFTSRILHTSKDGFLANLPGTYVVPSAITVVLMQLPLLIYTLLPIVFPPTSATKQKQVIVAKAIGLAVGVHFSFALAISGMLKPTKVLGFLCLSPRCLASGAWDPSLAMVAIGGILPASAAYFSRIKHRQDGLRKLSPSRKDDSGTQQHQHLRPALYLASPEWRTPVNPSKIDVRLIVGAILFGIGWGATGLCPGPAIVSFVTLLPSRQDSSTLYELATFVVSMAAGGIMADSL